MICRWVLLPFLLLALMPTERGWGVEIELGGGSTFARYETLHEAPVATLSLVSQAASRFPTEWSLGYVFAQDANPANRFNNHQATFWAGVGKRWRWRAVYAGAGLVLIDRTSQRLSTHLNFKTQLGCQLGPVFGAVQHISNAGLDGANDGETFFTLGYRWTL